MNKCLYIEIPPPTISCWYCQQKCNGINLTDHVDYFCYRHEPMTVIVSCVKHSVSAPNWFFNRIKIEYGDFLRLYWNFYAGPDIDLEHRHRTIAQVLEWQGTDWIPTNINQFSGWKSIKRYPSQMLTENSIEKIGKFFKLYRVWS